MEDTAGENAANVASIMSLSGASAEEEASQQAFGENDRDVTSADESRHHRKSKSHKKKHKKKKKRSSSKSRHGRRSEDNSTDPEQRERKSLEYKNADMNAAMTPLIDTIHTINNVRDVLSRNSNTRT